MTVVVATRGTRVNSLVNVRMARVAIDILPQCVTLTSMLRTFGAQQPSAMEILADFLPSRRKHLRGEFVWDARPGMRIPYACLHLSCAAWWEETVDGIFPHDTLPTSLHDEIEGSYLHAVWDSTDSHDMERRIAKQIDPWHGNLHYQPNQRVIPIEEIIARIAAHEDSHAHE